MAITQANLQAGTQAASSGASKGGLKNTGAGLASGAAAGAAIGSVVPGIGNVVGGVVGAAAGAVAGLYKDLVHQDNQFIKYRDDVMAVLQQFGYPISDWESIFGKYKLAHKDIPDRKASDYSPEFSRLRGFVKEYLESKQPGLGAVFIQKDKEFAAQYLQADPARSYKGAPGEALRWVLTNKNQFGQDMSLNGIFSTAQNVFQGLNVGQAQVNTSTGGIVVPQAQQGNGIMGMITNAAASFLPSLINGSQVTSTTAANLGSGGTKIASGGGITITGQVGVGSGVTKTSGTTGTNGNGGGMLLIGLAIAALLLFSGALKKLFK